MQVHQPRTSANILDIFDFIQLNLDQFLPILPLILLTIYYYVFAFQYQFLVS
jgi:hypothetical protein